MKTILRILASSCIFGIAFSQGYLHSNYDLNQHNPYKRQLTSQQANYVNDQQQHRFNLQPSQSQQSQFIISQQPSIEIPVKSNELQQQSQIRFPQTVQHHTQTKFIPNFVQQPRESLQHQRSVQNQIQSHQLPLPVAPLTVRNNAESDLHSQNFYTLRNHYAQQQPGQQLQRQQQPTQFAQQSPPAQTSPQFFPNHQQPPQFQTAPQFHALTPSQQQQFLASQQLQQQAKQNFQSSSSFQTAPQFNSSPQLNGNPENVKVIQKHEQFVQKQYEKQQSKVKQLHDEFVQKQQQLKTYNLNNRNFLPQAPSGPGARSREILPTEAQLFDNALKKHFEEHPTTTQKVEHTTTSPKKSNADSQFESLLQAHRQDIYKQLGLESEKKSSKGSKSKPGKNLNRDDLLKQLKAALAEQPQPELNNKTFDTMDLVLPNGQKVQVIRTTDPDLIKNDGSYVALSGGLSSLQSLNLAKDGEEASKSIPSAIQSVAPLRSKDLLLPNGEHVEIVRQSDPTSIGGLTELPDDDSSRYSQSLANEARVVSADGPPSIEELARKGLIPEGYEIIQQPAPGSNTAAAAQPPPPAEPKKPTYVYLEEQADGSFKVQGVKANGENEAKTSGAEVDSILERIKKGDIQLPPTVKKVKLPGEEYQDDQVPAKTIHSSTVGPPSRVVSLTPRIAFEGSTSSPYSTLSSAGSSLSSTHLISSQQLASTTPAYISERLVQEQRRESNSAPELSEILKSNGLYAMAKYLKQSGLDGILNETGPYTVFAPTDKAFKNLLIQLGGPERAEDKFKSNPRLLSGLLLHHVIPGSFRIGDLQDEMTGVSLAGTQLRVNQYTMHDQEWNDVLITTINGAMVVSDKHDISIPQGIAHAVDRVMFPLPVGDLLQTLQSDREKRFSTFLKILYTSGVSEILQNKGTKTYTVFAPTDKSFADLSSEESDKLTSDKEAAQAFVMRHIMPSTLFSAGMRFYMVKDSILPGKSITLQKTSSGKIKVNESQMVTSNIPATNGVIHALDGIL